MIFFPSLIVFNCFIFLIRESECEDSVEESPKPKRFKRTARRPPSSSMVNVPSINAPQPSSVVSNQAALENQNLRIKRRKKSHNQREEHLRLFRELELVIYGGSIPYLLNVLERVISSSFLKRYTVYLIPFRRSFFEC